MRQPADLAQLRETNPRLPPGEWERVSGYGVMGLTFRSGHVLGLRRWTASSIGDRFTSIWHRDPAGRWTFYETSPCEVPAHDISARESTKSSPNRSSWTGRARDAFMCERCEMAESTGPSTWAPPP
jgi:hypothetical protein